MFLVCFKIEIPVAHDNYAIKYTWKKEKRWLKTNTNGGFQIL